MVKIEVFQKKYQSSVIKLIKEILGDEFGFKVNKEKSLDLWSIDETYQKTGGNFWVALYNDDVIGTLALKNVGNKRGYLKRMYIQEKHRGQGVALNLLNTLLDFAKSQGFKTVYLGTSPKMTAASKFYQKHNFKKIQKLPPDLPTFGDTIFYKFEIK